MTTEEAGGPKLIEDDLAVLTTAPRLPVDAIRRCLLKIDETAPTLRAILTRAAAGEILSDDEVRLLRRGVYVLGGARDTEACQPLLRLLRLPDAELYHFLGGALTDGMTRIIASVFDGNVDALFALIADRSADPFARTDALDAATFLTWKGSILRDRMAHFLESFHMDKLAADQDLVLVSWMNAVALLGLRDLAPLVHGSLADGQFCDWLDRGEFDDLLAEAEQRPDDASRFAGFGIGYIEDVVDALAWSDDAEIDEDAFEARCLFSPAEPIRNPWRHVGRNDPCPCGSGLKAKRCCLAHGR
jgi:hypothetical protein